MTTQSVALPVKAILVALLMVAMTNIAIGCTTTPPTTPAGAITHNSCDRGPTSVTISKDSILRTDLSNASQETLVAATTLGKAAIKNASETRLCAAENKTDPFEYSLQVDTTEELIIWADRGIDDATAVTAWQKIDATDDKPPTTIQPPPSTNHDGCTILGEAKPFTNRSPQHWADQYNGVCADFSGVVTSSRGQRHILQSHDAPYGITVVVEGTQECLNTEHVPSYGTVAEFVGQVDGTEAVDNLLTGGTETLPIVRCWDGDRNDLLPYWCVNLEPIETRYRCTGNNPDQKLAPAPGTPLPPTPAPIPTPTLIPTPDYT